MLGDELPALARIDHEVRHAGVDHARGNAVRADPARPVLDCERPGQELDARFRSRVGGVLGPGTDARDRGEIDNRRSLLEVWKSCTADVERSRQVHGDRPVPLLHRQVGDWLPGRVDRGGIHDHVETPERLHGRPDPPRGLLPAADVGGHRRRLAELGPEGFQALPVAREKRKPRAFAGERDRNRLAEAAGRPGEECPPPGQPFVHRTAHEHRVALDNLVDELDTEARRRRKRQRALWSSGSGRVSSARSGESKTTGESNST